MMSYPVNNSGCVVCYDIMQPVKGMDWIERLFYTDTDQLVLGFHTVRLITINISCDNLLSSSTALHG